MNGFVKICLSAVVLMTSVVSSISAVEGRDRVVLRGNSFPAIVEHETRDALIQGHTFSTNLQTRRWSEVIEIVYAAGWR